MKYLFSTLYRIWFYILIAVAILILLPGLLISISSEKLYPFFFKLARIWAKIVFYGMGFRIKKVVREKYIAGKSYVFVANHTSMMDIMLMLIVVPNNPFVFVGKQELAKLPLFGFFYKRTCILVDRSSSKSRFQVFEQAQNRLSRGLSLCIFPEGGVPDESVFLDQFKDGAFRLSIEHQIPIAPITFADIKNLFSFRFFSGKPGTVRVTLHPTISTTGLTLEQKNQLKETTRNVIYHELEQYYQ